MTDDRQRLADVFRCRLYYLRNLCGFTQAELAGRSDVPVSSISHFENGHRFPSCLNVVRLADAMSTSTDYLLGRSDRR